MIPHSDAATPHKLQHVQRARKSVLRVAFVLCACVLLFTDSAWRTRDPAAFELISLAGIVLILGCILGRTWCTLYIGGQKKKQLVTQGPYSVVRNPLYVFTIVGAAGIGAQAGSMVMTALLGVLVAFVFYAVAVREQAFLSETFGAEYATYAKRVPLFFPRFSLWQEAEQLSVNPQLVRRTFRDASLFLLAIPINALIDWLQDGGWLPVLMRLL
jgi:protein-S-isoprenylcysteine O-methyltransferase Ste14